MFYMLDNTSAKRRWLDISHYNDSYGFRSQYDGKFTWFEGSRFVDAPPEPFEIKLRPLEENNPDDGPLIPSLVSDR